MSGDWEYAEIDFCIFAERVPPGTRVRDQNRDGEIKREGVLLEIYPHRQEEEIDYRWYPSCLKFEEQVRKNPELLIQEFQATEPYSLLIHDWVVFLIDGKWQTLKEVMGW
jgi:hypothetical protein